MRRPTKLGSPTSSPVAPGFLSLKSPKKSLERAALSADGFLDVTTTRAVAAASADAADRRHWCVLRDAALLCYRAPGDARLDALPAQAAMVFDVTTLR
jgi:hypothetical protein